MIRRIVFVFLVVGFGGVGCAGKTRTSDTRSGAKLLTFEEAMQKYATVDPTRASSFSGDSSYKGGGSMKVKEYGGAKSAYTKSFRSKTYDTHSFLGGKKARDKTFETSAASLSTKGRVVKNIDTSIETRTADTRTFSSAGKSSSYGSEFSTHTSAFRGKEQKQLDREDVGRKDLTIDDVREILNKR